MTDKEVLNHGFVRLIDQMGSEQSIVKAARVSYGPGTKTKREDDKLISYLYRHDHMSPFEMVQFTFHVKAPIFVARQWFRHRTGSFNEISGRYSEIKDEFFVPEEDTIMGQHSTNKQSREAELAKEVKSSTKAAIDDNNFYCYTVYQDLLKMGVSRELARVVLPVSVYTEFYWSVNLRNLLHFLELRSDPHAQYEIRVYSDAIIEILKERLPVVMDLFIDQRIQV